ISLARQRARAPERRAPEPARLPRRRDCARGPASGHSQHRVALHPTAEHQRPRPTRRGGGDHPAPRARTARDPAGLARDARERGQGGETPRQWARDAVSAHRDARPLSGRGVTDRRDRDDPTASLELVAALTGVVGGAELLLETDPDAEQRRRVQGVAGAARSVTRVLREDLSPFEPRESSPPGSSGVEGGRVLVVEDDDFTRALLERALASVGCRVDTAVSGMDAVQKFATAVYDVVLMDCHLPGVDGFETAREIRRLESERDRVPVIAVTAAGIDGLREACRAAGMDDVITKPFE